MRHEAANARGTVLTSNGFRRIGMIGALAAAALLTACSREATEAESIAAARKSLADGQTRAAVIHLRNALQHNANSPEGRLLMGEALLANGEIAAAYDEFKRARSSGSPDAAVVPPMARAMILLGQDKKLIEEFGAMRFDDKRADADLSLSLAQAYDASGNMEQVNQLLDRSLAARPDYAPALIYRARVILAKSGPEAALVELQSHPDLLKTNFEAAGLEGSLKLNGRRDVDGAIESFKRALALQPKDVHAHASLIAVYLYKGDKEAVRKQVDALKKALPNTPVARLYEAQLALLDGDAKTARALAMQVLQAVPQNVRAMYIAASAELQLGNSFHAVTLLLKALSLQPDLQEASKLLAQAYLKSGQPQLALKALARPLERAPDDVALLSAAAEAHLQLGDARASEALYKKALAVKPDDSRTRTALAMATIARGDDAEGLSQLAALAQQDASPMADLALISSYLARNQVDAALKQMENLERKEPGKPGPAFTRGRILLLKGDNVGARSAFEEALKRDPAYVSAMSNLALLDLRDGKVDAARARFEAALKAAPNNVSAMIALADLLVIVKAPQSEVTALLERAIAAEPSQVPAHLMLVDYLLMQKNYSAAVVAGQKAVAVVDSSPELLNALGRAQSAAGDSAQAQASFAKQAQLQPTATAPYLSAADAYRRAGDRANTIKSLRQALSINPQLLAAQEQLFAMELRSEQFPAALTVARDVQRQRPLAVQGYLWEGSVHEAQRRWELALATYKRGVDKLRAEKREAAALGVAQHQALLAAKKQSDAVQFVQDWLRVNPRDVAFRLYLGDSALLTQDWATAERHYRSVLEINPDHALAVNNVAAVLVRQKRPEAVEMAQRAVKLAPTSADAFDTLAMALAVDKQWQPALDAQRKAVALAPDASLPKIKLARMLIDAGKKTEAETQLKALQALGGKFERQADVSALLKQL
ncbi:XrtA/PEP-CTERM system TPR-repeat protein PrsT [Roseateles sp. DC23W]